MGIAFVTSADRGKFDDGRLWANCYFFEDYRDDDGNHIGYKPGKSSVTPEIAEYLLKNGVGMYEISHKPRPNSTGKAVSTVVRAALVKPLDLFAQVDLSKINVNADGLYVISFDRGQLQDKTNWRNAFGLQAYREDSDDSMGYKPMKFDVQKSLEDTFLKGGVGFYACDYSTRPVNNAKSGNVESVMMITGAEVIKAFDVFGWFETGKGKPLTSVLGVKSATEKVAA